MGSAVSLQLIGVGTLQEPCPPRELMIILVYGNSIAVSSVTDGTTMVILAVLITQIPKVVVFLKIEIFLI